MREAWCALIGEVRPRDDGGLNEESFVGVGSSPMIGALITWVERLGEVGSKLMGEGCVEGGRASSVAPTCSPGIDMVRHRCLLREEREKRLCLVVQDGGT